MMLRLEDVLDRRRGFTLSRQESRRSSQYPPCGRFLSLLFMSLHGREKTVVSATEIEGAGSIKRTI